MTDTPQRLLGPFLAIKDALGFRRGPKVTPMSQSHTTLAASPSSRVRPLSSSCSNNRSEDSIIVPVSPLSCPSPGSLKRKRDESSSSPPPIMSSTSSPALNDAELRPPLAIIEESTTSDTDEDLSTVPVPPSPVPTEIIEDAPQPIDQALMVDAVKAEGIKVRDFYYESFSVDCRAPEVWRHPLHTLVLHDRYIRAGPTNRLGFKLPGKMLWRLLHSGLVTPLEAKRNWSEADWDALQAYETQPGGPYPYCKPHVKRPTAAYRRHMRLDVYSASADDKPEEQIYVPPDQPGMIDAPEERRPTDDAPGADEDGRSPKKRRLSDADVTSRSPSPTNTGQPSSPRSTSPRVESTRTSEETAGSATPSDSRGNSRSASPRRSPTPPPEDAPPKLKRVTRGLTRTQTMVW